MTPAEFAAIALGGAAIAMDLRRPFCVLPSLFVVTVGPVLTRLARDLFPMIEKM
jgi:hypothetical protein